MTRLTQQLLQLDHDLRGDLSALLAYAKLAAANELSDDLTALARRMTGRLSAIGVMVAALEGDR